MNRIIAPPTLPAPAANYAHAVHCTAGSRMLHTSGVVPVRNDGTVPALIGQQAELVWSNIAALIEEADMSFADIVSVTTYVVAGNDLEVVMAARDRALGGTLAASTLVLVPQLAQSAWQMEIAIVAAAP